jgi:hypothetical protein
VTDRKAGEKKPQRDPAQRTNAPKALGVSLGRLTRPIMKQRGVALAEIINRWSEIAGPLLVKETQPEKMVYASGAGHAATLEIAVSPAFALELQHLSPLIIEKIKRLFRFPRGGETASETDSDPPPRVAGASGTQQSASHGRRADQTRRFAHRSRRSRPSPSA